MRTWERNPQYYGDLLSTSLAGQVLFDYAPLAERARRVLSKLRQVPRLMQAARDNIKDPPGIFVKVGLESLRGTLRFIEDDLPRAFGGLDDLRVLGDLADASTEAARAIGAYVDVPRERPGAARARAPSASAASASSRSCASTKGITLDADRLLAIADARAAGDAGGIPPRRVAPRRRRSPAPRGPARRTTTRRRAARRRPRRSSSTS